MPLFVGHVGSASTGGTGSGGVSNHEALTGLLGGDVNGHYHVTLEQLQKLGQLLTSENFQKIIELLTNGNTQGLYNSSLSIIKEIVIPSSGWQGTDPSMPEHADYPYYQDVQINGVTKSDFPIVSLHTAALAIAGSAGLCPTVQTLDGALRFFSRQIPTGDMPATAAIFAPASSAGSGGNGNLDIATPEEIAALFPPVSSGASGAGVTLATTEEVSALFNA